MPHEKDDPSICDFVQRRAGHTLVSFEERLYLWGGYMEKSNFEHNNLRMPSDQLYHSSCDVWTYQPLLDTWTRRLTRGDIPPQLTGSCATVHSDNMYIFGGFGNFGTRFESGNINMLWKLNLRTLTWKLMNPKGDLPFPVDKSACWTYKNRIYIFGGFGPRISYDTRKMLISFVPSEIVGYSLRGWIGQLAYYDIDKNDWIWPKMHGVMPKARAAHSTIVSGDYAYVFGGRHMNQRLNDLHRLHLLTHTWDTDLTRDEKNVPQGRSWHTLTLFTPNKAFLYGGFNEKCEVLDDGWILDLSQLSWTKLCWLKLCPRAWHTAVLLCSGEVSILGGVSNNLLDITIPNVHAEDFDKVRFTPHSLKRLSLESTAKAGKVYPGIWSFLPGVLKEILEIRTSDNKYINF